MSGIIYEMCAENMRRKVLVLVSVFTAIFILSMFSLLRLFQSAQPDIEGIDITAEPYFRYTVETLYFQGQPWAEIMTPEQRANVTLTLHNSGDADGNVTVLIYTGSEGNRIDHESRNVVVKARSDANVTCDLGATSPLSYGYEILNVATL